MSDNPYAAPSAVVADVVPQGEIMKADRGERLLAAIVDGVTFMVIMVPLLMSGAFMADGSINPDIMGASGVLTGFAFLVLVVINFVMLHKTGQTIGKKVVGVKIVRVDGSRASLRRIFFLRILVNSLIGMIPLAGGVYSLVDVLFIFGEERRCVHDYIAGTVVIKA